MLIHQEKLLTDIETKEIDHIAQVCVYTLEKIQIKIKENPPIWTDSIVRKKPIVCFLKYKAFF